MAVLFTCVAAMIVSYACCVVAGEEEERAARQYEKMMGNIRDELSCNESNAV